MAFIVDQQSEFKYFCKICSKRFGCGRALGGHMRAHGIGDESRFIDDDDLASDWEDKLLEGNVVPPNNERMYRLRTNPNRLKSCRVCENCGKEFFSWKSFLEHGKCSSRPRDIAESLVSSQGSEGDDDGITRRGSSGYFSKRKRSLRSEVGNFNAFSSPSSEEEDLANCLMMLSNATVVPLVTEPEESCTSASKEEERRNTMNFITHPAIACRPRVPTDKAKGLFECKACKKVFNSHQALGGHRASHKKVKGCFAARVDDSLADEDHHGFFLKKPTSTFRFDDTLASTSKKKSKVHECSICHRVFSSGQALGGHKRCHWITSNSPVETSSLGKFHQLQHQVDQIQQTQRPNFVDDSEPLDLNLPAPVDELVRRNHIHPSSFDVSTKIYLQPCSGIDATEKEDNQNHLQVDNTNNNCSNSKQNGEDKAKSKVKLAKLSELKDINMSGGSSPWLQVGIGSDP
ncbi:hypothetical protein Goshw_006916 [Gossypium schwendimanii]|uniref:C2H2-type domain-containing protein n=1 Tax=Gossypium schwendimanii TaxID=34291 RepID=A0A7J9LL02_GOSSC|nr:hypothetical protein [Gossypium schwendimanii]